MSCRQNGSCIFRYISIEHTHSIGTIDVNEVVSQSPTRIRRTPYVRNNFFLRVFGFFDAVSDTFRAESYEYSHSKCWTLLLGRMNTFVCAVQWVLDLYWIVWIELEVDYVSG